MRVLRGAVLLLGWAGGLSAGQPPPGPCQSSVEFENRLAAWTASGVRRYAETGSALSECLVADDDRFFRRMGEQPKVYDAWLQSLGSDTFTVLDPSQRPRVVELKTQMTEIAVRRSGDPSYGALAKALSEQLAKTEVVDIPAALTVPAGAWEVSLPSSRPIPVKPPPADIARDFPGVVVIGADGSVSGLPASTAQNRSYVEYKVKALYPAATFLAMLRQRLEKDGWQPLPRNWDYWTKRSSLDAGWELYPDFREPKGQFHWTAQWRNTAGDELDYKLNYDTRLPETGAKVAEPDNEILRVYASLAFQRFVPVESLPPALVVAGNAQNVVAWQNPDAPDKRGVKYTLRAPYPAPEILATLSDRFAQLGWEPVPDEDEWGPPTDIPGWRSRLDNYGRPTAEFFEWKGEWRDKTTGDQTRYTLTYASAPPVSGAKTTGATKPDNDDLFVEARFRPKPPAKPKESRTAGQPHEGRFYTSPSGSFRVRVPSSRGQVQTREGATRRGWAASFRDELCREFVLEEYSVGLGRGSLDAWIEKNLIPSLRESQFETRERKSVSSERGAAVLLRGVRAGGSPCTRSIVKDGERRMEKIDQDARIYVLPAGNRVYVFLYGTNAGDKTVSHFTGTAEEVLDRFVEDFEVLKPAPASRTSKSKS